MGDVRSFFRCLYINGLSREEFDDAKERGDCGRGEVLKKVTGYRTQSTRAETDTCWAPM